MKNCDRWKPSIPALTSFDVLKCVEKCQLLGYSMARLDTMYKDQREGGKGVCWGRSRGT